ncbi:MAG: carboxypeptidase-like regulatory domain-containing protein, partial [Bacteroidetes bacterium]|nr:carboxypeptidase-like regulatory domain-containing protein [Bacteroidota bacterium]
MKFIPALLLLPLFTQAAVIKGRVTDERQQPLAYATVYLKNTSIGTTSNEDGYYSLEAPAGSYEIVFQYIGYGKFSERITLENEPLIINAILQLESVSLKEVTVTAGTEDPAYAIIRQAQKKRKYYLNQVKAYSCNVYIKGIQGLDRIPEKIFGMSLKKQGIDSSMLGIIYLSESESQYNFEKPDKVKEIVFSSKVAGNNNAFSWNS